MSKHDEIKNQSSYFQYLDLTLRAVPISVSSNTASVKAQTEAAILKKIAKFVALLFVGYVILGNILSGYNHLFKVGQYGIAMHGSGLDTLFVQTKGGIGYDFTGTFYDSPDNLSDASKTVVITPHSLDRLKIQSLYAYNNPPNPILDFLFKSPTEGFSPPKSHTSCNTIYVFNHRKTTSMKTRFDLSKPVYFVIDTPFSKSMLPLNFNPPSKEDNRYR